MFFQYFSDFFEILILVLLISCADKNSISQRNVSDDYMRNFFSERKFLWVSELESNILIKEPSSTINLNKNLKLNQQIKQIILEHNEKTTNLLSESLKSLGVASL